MIFAHRGASAYKLENTMEAFRLAHEMNADGIELDVQCTADGVVVVFHDDKIDRIAKRMAMETGKDTHDAPTGEIRDYTYEQLRALDLGGYYVPQLTELMDFVAGTNMCLNIEIKSSAERYNPALIQKTAEIINSYNFKNRIIVSSFHHQALVDIKKHDADIATGILYDKAIDDIAEYAEKIGAAYIHPHFSAINRDIVESCEKKNIKANVWTVDDPEMAKWLLEIGVNAVISNKPDVI